MKNKKDKFEISELFMATAGGDFSRCFYGTIKIFTNPDGSGFVVGKIPVNSYEVIARANDDKELGAKLDELVIYTLKQSTKKYILNKA